MSRHSLTAVSRKRTGRKIWDRNTEQIYQHRQVGKALRVVFILILATIGLIALKQPELPGQFGALTLAVIAIVFWLFGSLNVSVDHREITASFGPGLIKRRIPINSILDVKIVRNSWIMGWGIRIIQNGFMFNVWGLDAVELKLRSGSVFRIGTDEPEKLENAIREGLQAKGTFYGQ